MEILKEILSFVTSKSDKAKVFPELIEDDIASTSLAGRFLNGMANETYANDEDAAKDLYGTDAGDQRFRTLKSRTYERLIRSVLFIKVDQPEHSEYLHYYYKCMSGLVAAQLLMRCASRRAGYAIACKTLTAAQKYEFTDICLPLAVLLRESSALWSLHSQFEVYCTKVRLYEFALVSEQESECLLDSLRLEQNSIRLERSYYVSKHKRVLELIRSMSLKSPSHILTLNLYRAEIAYLETIEDFQQVKRQCDFAIAYLAANNHLSQRARHGEFLLRGIAADIYTRKRIDSTHGKECLSMLVHGGPNWFAAQSLLFASSFQNMELENANNIYCDVISHSNFKRMDQLTIERWNLHGAYIKLAELLKLHSPEQSSVSNFRLTTFLNSMIMETRSKQDSNSLIVIFHAFYLLLNNRYDEAEKRIEYLNVYCTRYLKEISNSRLWLFVKATQAIPRNRGNAAGLRRAWTPALSRIKEAFSIPMPAEINELIPYDVLMEAYLRTVEEKSHISVVA